MSLQVFPTLPTMAWDSTKTQRWPGTVIQKSGSGRRKSLCQQAYPEWVLECSYTALSDSEIAKAAGFFALHQGQTKPFLWLDDTDYQETGVRIGTGDGHTDEFQLLRNLGGYYVEPARDIVADTLKVYVAEVETAVTPQADGWVKFAEAPAVGAAITADFRYYWRVAFDTEGISWPNFWYGFYKLKTVRLVTVR